ncbi:putative fatty acyl-CoA reductase CG5065 [Phlebotomus papatasi]|uniref:putative fatty acyl-CoA reductase CG5065 n=1 Tax=Phlebotomus papatasi TaxID=29031 RepID=UPI00248355ED|nr:putative fatty acyl-CoA reductase CG5065 [Phlebotomus papatasi]
MGPKIESIKHSESLCDTECSLSNYVSIPQCYTDRSVFITGATGFVGKVLVEKLLRSCPGIKNIYVLIRPKRGQEVKARLNDLLGAPLFDTLRRERPNDLNKVIPICGDITSEKLGISENDQALLCRTVSIVFHSAATVKFDEKLKLSVAINMLGTKRLVELCHRMMSLDALVHVSTAYCNCDRAEVSEVIYAPPYNPNDIISLVDWLPEDMLDDLTPQLIGKRPNTYTFTKALAEHMLLNEAGNLPVAIVRPSIVLSSLNEPLPGWQENMNGPTASILLHGMGIVQVFQMDKSKLADLVPVDFVVNLVIASAWNLSVKRKTPGSPIVYNCSSGLQNSITWGRFCSLNSHFMKKYPLENVILYPMCLNAKPRGLYHSILTFYLQTIPAYIVDLFFWLTKRKQKMVSILQKYNKGYTKMEYFSMRQWSFSDGNVRELFSTLSSEDRELFNFDMKSFSWESYLERYVLGIRKYLLKQNFNNIDESRRKLQKLYWINIALIFLVVAGLVYIFYQYIFLPLAI